MTSRITMTPLAPGRRLGKLTLVRCYLDETYHDAWIVRCDCGRQFARREFRLRRAPPMCSTCSRRLSRQDKRRSDCDGVRTEARKHICGECFDLPDRLPLGSRCPLCGAQACERPRESLPECMRSSAGRLLL